MALKQVKDYYLQVQAQYLEMVDDAKDFDEALKAGMVEQSQFDQAQEMLTRIKENYERLSYIMYLFMQPKRKEKVAKFNKQNKLTQAQLEKYSGSQTTVMSENEDVLKEFKKLIREIKSSMDVKEFAKSIGLEQDGYQDGAKYIIELVDSNEFSRVYTLLDKSELLDIQEDATLLTDKVGELLYLSDDYDVKLVGNFISDIYRVVITEGK